MVPINTGVAVREKCSYLPVTCDGLQVKLLILLEIDKGKVAAYFTETPLHGLPDLGHGAIVLKFVRSKTSALVWDLIHVGEGEIITSG